MRRLIPRRGAPAADRECFFLTSINKVSVFEFFQKNDFVLPGDQEGAPFGHGEELENVLRCLLLWGADGSQREPEA